MVAKSKVFWALGALLTAGALAAACGSNGANGSANGTSSGTCIPNASVPCACLGGTMGVQICQADGKSYSMCQCSSTGTGGSTTTSFGGTGGSACQCSNPGGELYCGASICNADAGTGDSGCANQVVFAGKAGQTFGSNWSYMGMPSLTAGNLACQAIGADHVCDYDDIVLAASKGELSTLTASDTAWLDRTHSVTIATGGPDIVVLGQAPAAGTVLKVAKSSRCADWTYSTDHLNDGEYVEFPNGGNSPKFHLDDNPCVIQTVPKDIPCGHNMMPREILCCYPKCTTVPDDTCTCNASNQCM